MDIPQASTLTATRKPGRSGRLTGSIDWVARCIRGSPSPIIRQPRRPSIRAVSTPSATSSASYLLPLRPPCRVGRGRWLFRLCRKHTLRERSQLSSLPSCCDPGEAFGDGERCPILIRSVLVLRGAGKGNENEGGLRFCQNPYLQSRNDTGDSRNGVGRRGGYARMMPS